MRRTVSARLTLDVLQPARAVLSVAVAHGAHQVAEQLTLTIDGAEVTATEVLGEHGTRLHVVDAAPGRLEVAYRAVVDGRDEPQPATLAEELAALRPSRYAESDTMLGLAQAQLGHLDAAELPGAVRAFVARHLRYVPGSTGPDDGAARTLLAGQGVCRDYAHLSVALLRALDVPARIAAVYAPGLSPMDFHAVAEACIDGTWTVVDATGLAPRSTMLRIATGRDAADTAFLSIYGGAANLVSQQVMAVVDGPLPSDDPTVAVALA